MGGVGAIGGFAAYPSYYYQRAAAVNRQNLLAGQPVQQASMADAGLTGKSSENGSASALVAQQGWTMSRSELPKIRIGADPVEMAVRGRIQQADSLEEVVREGECQTCKKRKYQDGSDDPGVSFKTPTNISPDWAAAAVRGHELEHVVREQAKAEREDRKVVQQSVTLHTGICPECGRVYISGGTTRTTTVNDNQEDILKQQKELSDVKRAA